VHRGVEAGGGVGDYVDRYGGSYGPFVSELLIAEALHPYPENLVIATKAGLQRPDRINGSRMGGQSTCGSVRGELAEAEGGPD